MTAGYPRLFAFYRCKFEFDIVLLFKCFWPDPVAYVGYECPFCRFMFTDDALAL